MDDETRWQPPDPAAPSTPPTAADPTNRRRPALAITLAVAVSLGLVGAGLFALTRRGGNEASEQVTTDTTSGRPSAAAILAAAPAASRAAGTAQIRTSMRSFEGGTAVKSVVAGIVAFDTSAYDLTYSFEGGGPLFFGSPGFGYRVFSDGTTIWSTIPPGIDVPLPGARTQRKNPFKGKKYLAETVGPSSTGSPVEQFGPHALGFSIGSAPADVLGYLNSVGTANEEGKERLDGEEVTRYGVDLDLDALQRSLPSEDRAFDAYDFRPDVPHILPAKAWLDGGGRLRKLTYRLDLGALLTDVALKADYVVDECPEPDPALLKKAEAGDPKAMEALVAAETDCPQRSPRPEELIIEGSVEISSYGIALAVTAPPAAEVVTADQFDDAMSAMAGEAVVGPPPTRASRP